MRPRESVAAADPDGWIGPPAAPFVRALGALAAFPGLVWGQRELLAAGIARDLTGRFRGSLLGAGWALLQPLALFALYAFAFTRLLGARLPGASGDEHAAWMLLGALSFGALAEGVTRASGALVEQRGLIQRLAFRVELLPLQAALAPTALFALVVLAALPALALWRGLGLTVLLVPVVLLLQALLVAGPALLCAAAHVFLRDTAGLLSVLLPAWMLLTPIFWSPSQVGAAAPAWLLEFNPAFHLVNLWRHALLPGLDHGAPLAPSLLFLACCAPLSLALGAAVLGAARAHLADEV